MSRALHWSLFLGCLGIGGLALRPAWNIACCPSPLASLSSEGCSTRFPALATSGRSGPGPGAGELEPSAPEELALVEAR